MVLPILDCSIPSTYYQRLATLRSLQRSLGRPGGGKLLVEIYLNYDCDLSGEENLWERLVIAIGRASTSGPTVSQPQIGPILPPPEISLASGFSISTANLRTYTKDQARSLYMATGDEAEARGRATELIVGVLAALYRYCREDTVVVERVMEEDQAASFAVSRDRKVRLAEGIKAFNRRPITGIRFLVEARVVPSKTPRHVAHFLMNCPGLEKEKVGEYLGEGDEVNVQTMHVFVDMIDFKGLTFVDGLRRLLDKFRLPGEAQKIDRIMIKFAQAFVVANPISFSCPDTAYVLAYSTIMLNTDLHNPQVKRRMTKDEFVRNNRGIDEGADLSMKVLEGIYAEIKDGEIKMREAAGTDMKKGVAATSKIRKSGGVGGFGGSSSDMLAVIKKHGATREPGCLDVAFSSLNHDGFVESTTHLHAKPMFQQVWMTVLMAISSALLRSEDLASTITALEGFKYAIHISCLFELELERKGFLSNMSKFIEINGLLELKEKNVETCKMLLEIAYIDGNDFGENWREVVKCVSQLEKIQSAGLIAVDPLK